MQGTAETLETTHEEVGSATLRTVSLRGFRNFSALDLTLPDAGVMIIGPNGSGKSNLLEALYYLEIFRSFRGARDRELVTFDQDVFRVEASVERAGHETRVAAAWQKSTRRKKVEVDGREPERLSDAIGRFGAVVFSLDDSELVWGSPSRRRRFLDILLSLVEPGYVGALQRYRTVVAQRNEALRQNRAEVARAWAEGLVVPGAQLMEARKRWVADRREEFAGYHAAIAGGETADLVYMPALGRADADPPAAQWPDRIRRALEESEASDMRRGITQVGPHRDDLAIRAVVDGGHEHRDLRSYGSGGQRRTAAIALRLVEADTLAERMGAEPVYLLDDVFAELDAARAERVLELLEAGRTGQVLLTAPKPVDLPLRGGALERWRIRDGVIEADV
ncbi:MAG: DNA replication/repair protein RecF [Gemmatimonadota bacterium]